MVICQSVGQQAGGRRVHGLVAGARTGGRTLTSGPSELREHRFPQICTCATDIWICMHIHAISSVDTCCWWLCMSFLCQPCTSFGKMSDDSEVGLGIKQQATSDKRQATSSKHHASSTKHHASSIKHQASSIKYQAWTCDFCAGVGIGGDVKAESPKLPEGSLIHSENLRCMTSCT